jgi:hypothetical protein
MPVRRPNAELRRREHLTEAEVERLIEAVKGNRWGLRDATMVLVAYRHGLRAAELVDLRWDQVDFETATLHVRRVKQGTPSTHPILGDELRALRRLQRDQAPKSPFSSSPRKEERPSPPLGLPEWSSEQGARPSWGLRLTPTCSGTPAAMPSPTGDTTRGHCKPTLGTAISTIRCAIPRCPRRGLRISGGGDAASHLGPACAYSCAISARNSDPGATPLMSSRSRARVAATYNNCRSVE